MIFIIISSIIIFAVVSLWGQKKLKIGGFR